jgi:2-polyprenyl-3-methyl-5-hydroxy-6-metoxy-1,4-benzoquinol methylase
MRILVSIASYGIKNDGHLSRILDEYRRMPHDVHIVVTSNIAKNLGPAIEVVVGLPSKNPWSLGFAHKRIFAERLMDYDLFIYSEDDVLIGLDNIEAFLRVTEVLPDNEVAGFMRTERDSDGKIYFSEVRQHFHWDAASVRLRGNYTFGFFTTEHAACYILTQDQLRRAIDSGGYLVDPHEGRHDLLVAAATDPYTQCGFKKMVCISHFDEFLIPHMTNKYVGKGILSGDSFHSQLERLIQISSNGKPKSTLFPIETKLYHEHWSKEYYEPCQEHLIGLVPPRASKILSVGCGWGATEGKLIEKGKKVKALPIDSVIAVNAEARGIEIVCGNLETAAGKLAGESFDCILFSNVLHLVRDPVEFLSRFTGFLNSTGSVVVSVPNLSFFRRLSRTFRLHEHAAFPRGYDVSGMHTTTETLVRHWLRRAGLKVSQVEYEISEDKKRFDQLSMGFARRFVGSNIYIRSAQII